MSRTIPSLLTRNSVSTPVRHPVEALDAAERRRIPVADLLRRWLDTALRILETFEQQGARRNRAILVARKRRDAQHLDGGRDQVRPALGGVVRCLDLEKGADVAVFDGAAEQVAALEHLLGIEDRSIADREHGADGPGETNFVRRERPARGHVQNMPGSEPANGEHRRIVGWFDREPAIGGQRRDRLEFERGTSEELSERCLQQVVVERAGSKNRRERHAFPS